MLKLNRTTEYGIMALSYIRQKENGTMSSAREIADRFQLPFEILAKTLQKLKENGVIESSQGTRGGYILLRNLKTLNLAEFIGMTEGSSQVVMCTHEKGVSSCEYQAHCNIQKVMWNLNDKIQDFLKNITLDELTLIPLQQIHHEEKKEKKNVSQISNLS